MCKKVFRNRAHEIINIFEAAEFGALWFRKYKLLCECTL